MSTLQKIGLSTFVISLLILVSTLFVGRFTLSQQTFDEYKTKNGIASEIFDQSVQEKLVNIELSATKFSSLISEALKKNNEHYEAKEDWDHVIWKKPQDISFSLMQESEQGLVANHKSLFFILTFGLGILGGVLFILSDQNAKGPAGIKHNGIYHKASTNRGWIAWIVFGSLISFYILLYFFPNLIINWVLIVDPVKQLFVNEPASQWFLYGLLYCTAMSVMSLRMFLKYRGNKYQQFRTASVLFFQIVFAFLLVEILPVFGYIGVDFKNAWPLDYDFLFDWNVMNMINGGYFGKFVFIWGILLSLIIIPVMVYFYGKRWYCSWVCGCGGLAETLGDPYRQHSDKSVKAWKFERYIINGVLVFAVLMTVWTGYHSYNEIYSPEIDYAQKATLLGISADTIRSWYGFLIGSIFAGVIGTGFYPIFGNRVWCRFGCPLAAYMGIVQRFKSRFRITTNGGQCISCGNCSTYCEQGIDVRAYAQKGQNIVRASCVGCGVCASVCPRGVLKLENGPNTDGSRMEVPEVILGNEGLKKLLKN